MSEVGAQPRGAISHARSSSCVGTGGLKGATPHSRSGGATLSKVRSSCKEILHVQGNRNPSQRVGIARGHQRADTLKP